MGLGDSLRKWATSKAGEMLSDVVEQATGGKSAGESTGKSTGKSARELAEEQQHREEVASLPLASVQLSVTGHATGRWSGQLHWARNDISPNDPDPTDPYADRPLVWFELFSEDTAPPDLGGLALTHWSFQIPGFHGDGTYDLTAINREREAAGAAPEYLEWAMDFANGDDASFYFYADAGQSTVTVSEGGKKLDVTIAMSGARGELVATATIAV